MLRSLTVQSLLTLALLLLIQGACSRADGSAVKHPAAASITSVTYLDWPAYRLTDGKTEAIVVPAIGRVMRYGRVGGANWLWNADPQMQRTFKPGQWRNWGGDKTWLAPQSSWPVIAGRRWPPDAAWDGLPQRAEVLTNGHLRTTSPIAQISGVRIIRDYGYDANGDFAIAQTIEKVRGAPLLAAVWDVTQIAPVDAIFLPINPHSAYTDGLHWLQPSQNESSVRQVSASMLMLQPGLVGGGKLGVDAPVAALVAVNGRTAFVERAAHPSGQYPDGALGSGFPVEVYNEPANSPGKALYSELELLSPLRYLSVGASWTHTVRWSLAGLSASSVRSSEGYAQIERLLLDGTVRKR